MSTAQGTGMGQGCLLQLSKLCCSGGASVGQDAVVWESWDDSERCDGLSLVLGLDGAVKEWD